ncbi:MAG: AsmA family protein [Candidatus Omnitrophota bacterium]
MKILKILFILFLILIVILITVAVIFVKTFDVNRFKPQIIAKAKEALNREVDFNRAELKISLQQGLSLKITDFDIASDVSFVNGTFLTVKEASCAIDILGYLFQKEVNISSIRIESPRITVIRKENGTLNLQTLAPLAGSSSASSAAALPALMISSLEATDGYIKYIDRSFEPTLKLEIDDVDFSVSRISPNKPFPFSASGAVLSDGQNIEIEGRAQFDLKAKEFRILDLKASTDLSKIRLKNIPEIFSATKDFNLPKSIEGDVDIRIDELIIGSEGIKHLALDASVDNGELRFKEMQMPIEDIEMDLKIRGDEILIKKIDADIADGSIEASGLVKDYLGKQNYKLNVDIKDFKLQDFFDPKQSKVWAEGIVSGKMDLSGQGVKYQDLLTLAGNIDLSIVKVKLKNINILRTVLNKISVIPGLAEKLEAELPQRFKEKLKQADTELLDIKLPLVIKNNALSIDNAVFGGDEFIFKGQGDARMNGVFSLEGAFLIPPDLSLAMVNVVGELEYLLDKQAQINIPLRITGKTTDFQFNVDIEYIAKRLLAEQGKTQLLNIIDKALGIGKEEEQIQTTTEGTQQQEQPKTETTEEAPAEKKEMKPEEIIGGILRDIFN